MPRARKIRRKPEGKNYYIVDASFLANKYIPSTLVTNPRERKRVERSKEWWVEIDKQLKHHRAIVYIPDVCIAEAFKVLAKKYYQDNYFSRPIDYKNARDNLSKDIHTAPKSLKGHKRFIRFHDISTSRDIIIAVDRFFEMFLKHNLNVSVVDLVLLATSKYLIDFYDIPQNQLYIVTLDNALWQGSKKLTDIPSAFNPDSDSEIAEKVFL